MRGVGLEISGRLGRSVSCVLCGRRCRWVGTMV